MHLIIGALSSHSPGRPGLWRGLSKGPEMNLCLALTGGVKMIDTKIGSRQSLSLPPDLVGSRSKIDQKPAVSFEGAADGSVGKRTSARLKGWVG